MPSKHPAKKPTKRKPPEHAPSFQVEVVALNNLKPHPKNYRAHPDDQLAHIVSSLRQHGVYRNIVVARDGTILAGHGVVEGAKKIGLKSIPVIRLNVDANDPSAIKALVGDNEIAHLAEDNDRLLTELLKQLKEESGDGLLGTGYDEMMLANLLIVTRPEAEIKDFNAAAAWVGMPEYEAGANKIQLVITFPTEDDRDEFVKQTNIALDIKTAGKQTWSTRWPWTAREDKASIRFQEEADASA